MATIPILLLSGANGVGKDEPPDVTVRRGAVRVNESDFGNEVFKWIG